MVEGGGVTGVAEGRVAVTGVIDVAAVDDHPIVLDGVAGWVAAAESGIRVVGTAATVGALLAGPGRGAHVVLLDLDLGDGTTVERNVAAILTAGPAVLVLAASDKPVSVRAAMRAGALGAALPPRRARRPGAGRPRQAGLRPGRDARRGSRLCAEERGDLPGARGYQGGRCGGGLDFSPPRLHIRYR